jgi:hypothetical protein
VTKRRALPSLRNAIELQLSEHRHAEAFMRITVEVPEGVFKTSKTPEQVADEMRQAAAVFWVARGDVAPEAIAEITASSPAAQEGTLYELLMTGPNVGDDADFERPLDHGRELPEWAS